MLERKKLSENWFIQSSEYLQVTGEIISQNDFQINSWHPVSVPTTVVAGLVSNGIYPDPFIGLNLKKIPGFKENVYQNFDNTTKPSTSPFLRSWWFRKEFILETIDQSKFYWLLFKGINYSANIWLNGNLIADNKEVVGTYRQFNLNITPFINKGVNIVALEVFSPKPDDLSISFVDWSPVPPDDNMGLWQPVILYQTGTVRLLNTHIRTELDVSDLQTAIITIQSELHNLTNEDKKIILTILIDNIVVEKEIKLKPYENLDVILDFNEFKQLVIKNPQIWWPYQLGTPFLYKAIISIKIDNTLLDNQIIKFGIRSIKSSLYKDRSRLFNINGTDLLIRGVAWTPDMMLRQSKERDNKEIALIKNLHVNAIRMEGKLGTDYFWDKCDEEGLLVLAGWVCCGFWEKWEKWNDKDLEIAKESLQSQLLRLRNHPSLLCWLYGSDYPPPEHVEREYLRICNDVSPDLTVLSSASDNPSKLTEATGIKMTGPYTYVPPIYWYSNHIGSAERFNAEAGPDVCIPPWESIELMIPKEEQFVGSETWNFHMGLGAFSKIQTIENALESRYGKPKDFRDFIKTAQILGYESWRAVFEAYARNFPIASGFIGWMGNSPWPSLIWQLFDIYYNTNGAYYGVQKACEPLHIQYSYDDKSIWLINNLMIDKENLDIHIQVLDIHSNEIYSSNRLFSIPKLNKIKVQSIPVFDNLSDPQFLLLRITKENKTLSRNFYWLPPVEDILAEKDSWPTTPVILSADMKILRLLPLVQITTSFHTQIINNQIRIIVNITNNSNSVAFFLRIIIIDKQTKKVILPVIWNENCINLLPYENYELRGTILKNNSENINSLKYSILVDGWNTG